MTENNLLLVYSPEYIIFICIILLIAVTVITVCVINTVKRAKALKNKEVKLNPENISKIENEIRSTERNAIELTVGGKAASGKCKTHFGGVPDVPEDFEWATYDCTTFDDSEVKPRHLNFLMQFDLEEIAAYDTENLLPHEGLLSFFHVIDAEVYGDEAKDMGCLRVFWFKDKSALSPANVPEELKGEKTFPALNIAMKNRRSLLSSDDLSEYYSDYDLDEYLAAVDKITENNRGEISSRLLGWANWVQYSDIPKFEKITRGGKAEITEEVINDWVLLLQLDPISDGDFDLMYGDCGSLYVYIRREDLAARRFDKTVFSWQCT